MIFLLPPLQLIKKLCTTICSFNKTPFSGVMSSFFFSHDAVMLNRKQWVMNAYQLLLITLVWSQGSQKQYPKVTNNCCNTAVPSYSTMNASLHNRDVSSSLQWPSLNSLAGEQSVQCCEGISKPQCVCHNSAVQKCERALKWACSLFSPIFMKYSHSWMSRAATSTHYKYSTTFPINKQIDCSFP